MIPARHSHILFALILSGLMSCLVSGLSTWRAVEAASSFPSLWLEAWLASWMVAFPAVLVVAPLTRRIVAALTRPD